MRREDEVSVKDAEQGILAFQLGIGIVVVLSFTVTRSWLLRDVFPEAVTIPAYFGSLLPAAAAYALLVFKRSNAVRFSLFFLFACLLLVFVLPIRESQFALSLAITWISTAAVLSFQPPLLRVVALVIAAGFSLAHLLPLSMWGHIVPGVGPGGMVMLSIVGVIVATLSWATVRGYEARIALSREIQSLSLGADQLFNANLGFQQYAANARIESALEERKRISREIHDAVGHRLINVIMMLQEAYDYAPDESRLGGLIHETRSEAQEALSSTRHAVRMLRQTVTFRANLSNRVNELSKTFEKATGVKVSLEFGNIFGSLNEETELSMYAVIQEAFTNAVRHGRASEVEVRFWIVDRHLTVTIEDNGRGATDIKEGVGLQSMQERVSDLGGHLEFESGVGRGFKTRIRVPVNQ